MAFVYKITSPSNRVYIGSSCQTQKARFNKYKNLNCEKQVRLYRSFLKYGVENHKFEILCECTKEDMRKLECQYGIFYNVLDNELGLNCVLPKFNDSYSVTEETKRKISNKLKGREWSEESRKKNSISLKGNRNALGTEKSEDWKKQTSLRMIGHNINKGRKQSIETIEKRLCHFYKEISQFNKNMVFIQNWRSLKEAGISLNIKTSNISAVLRGKQKSTNGYIFKYNL